MMSDRITIIPIGANVSSQHVYVTTTMEHVTSESADEILWRLNSKKVLLLLPVIIYVFLCVTLGLIGNSFVCYIYTYRLKRSPSRIFILFLSILDMTSCIVGSSSELTDLFQPYVFNAPWSCKVLRFGLSFTIIAACFTLSCVAFDRYYKVCKPLNAFPTRKIKYLCVTVVALSLFLSWPALVIFGLKTVTTDTPGLSGAECSTADEFQNSVFPVAYYVILFLAFIILLTCFVLLYIRIGIEIWKRKRLTIGETLPALLKEVKKTKKDRYARTTSVLADDVSNPSYPTDDLSDSRGVDNLVDAEDSCTQNKNNTLGRDSTQRPNSRPVLRRRRSNMGRMSIRTLRTTSIFFAVSVAFVLSFLPYLIANMLKFSKVAFYDIQSPSTEVVYNFCVRSYFISNFVNPIIYSALNINFRRECRKLIKRMIERVKRCCACKEEKI